MKNKKAHLLLLLLVGGFYLIGAQQIAVRELETARIFAIGSENDQVGIGTTNATGARDRPGVGYIDGQIVVDDFLNGRFLLLDNELVTQGVMERENRLQGFSLTDLGEGVSAIYINDSGMDLFKDFVLFASIKTTPSTGLSELYYFRSFAYYGDVLFVHDKNLNLWSIPSLDWMRRRIVRSFWIRSRPLPMSISAGDPLEKSG